MAVLLLLGALAVAHAAEPEFQNDLILRVNTLDTMTLSYERIAFYGDGYEGSWGFDLAVEDGVFVPVVPFLTVGRYGESTSIFMEFYVPEGYLPYVGKSGDWFTLGVGFHW
jgi:hypothetical protein